MDSLQVLNASALPFLCSYLYLALHATGLESRYNHSNSAVACAQIKENLMSGFVCMMRTHWVLVRLVTYCKEPDRVTKSDNLKE